MRSLAVLGLSTCLLLVAGCTVTAETPNDEAAALRSDLAAADYVPEAGLAAHERLRKAIALLEVGDLGRARAELDAYAAEVPDSRLAPGLIRQIETDPERLFGETSSAYRLQPGESLSTVARRMLGDAMLSYALARYNGVSAPSAIAPGQAIRVPKSPLDLESEIERHQARLMMADDLSGQGDFQGAAALYEEGLAEFPEDQTLKRLAAANYLNIAGLLGDTGQSDLAADALRRVHDLDPGDPKLLRRLASIERKAGAQLLYDEGLDLYADNRPADAYKKFSEAASLDPAHLGAREKMAEVARVVADRWHREALGHFRRQDLEAALGLWDKVLEIDPSHGEARFYRAQAEDLNEKLKTLQDQ